VISSLNAPPSADEFKYTLNSSNSSTLFGCSSFRLVQFRYTPFQAVLQPSLNSPAASAYKFQITLLSSSMTSLNAPDSAYNCKDTSNSSSSLLWMLLLLTISKTFYEVVPWATLFGCFPLCSQFEYTSSSSSSTLVECSSFCLQLQNLHLKQFLSPLWLL
jgi:hypothetical protein